jgi:hypothetical protein
LPARIGTPPPTPTTPGICRRKDLAGSSSSFIACSEVWLRVRAEPKPVKEFPMTIRLTIAAVLIALAALPAPAARANDCEAKASEIVSKLGATIERRSTSHIFLKHGAVPGDLSIGCDSVSPADGPDVFLAWDVTDHPTDVFW